MSQGGSWRALTHASSRVENGNANSNAPGTISSLASAPKARTNLAAQDKIKEYQMGIQKAQATQIRKPVCVDANQEDHLCKIPKCFQSFEFQ